MNFRGDLALVAELHADRDVQLPDAVDGNRARQRPQHDRPGAVGFERVDEHPIEIGLPSHGQRSEFHHGGDRPVRRVLDGQQHVNTKRWAGHAGLQPYTHAVRTQAHLRSGLQEAPPIDRFQPLLLLRKGRARGSAERIGHETAREVPPFGITRPTVESAVVEMCSIRPRPGETA